MSSVLVDKKLQFVVAVFGDLSASTRIENWLQHTLYEGSSDDDSSSTGWAKKLDQIVTPVYNGIGSANSDVLLVAIFMYSLHSFCENKYKKPFVVVRYS